MHVPGNGHSKGGQLLGFKIIEAICSKIPFGSKAETVIKGSAGSDRSLELLCVTVKLLKKAQRIR